MGAPLTRAALDAVLVDDRREDCDAYVGRLDPIAPTTPADCMSDGHYLCKGCARLSPIRIGEYLAENPHIRAKVKAATVGAPIAAVTRESVHQRAVDHAIDTGFAELAELRRSQPAESDRVAWIRWNDRREAIKAGVRAMQEYCARRWIR
jgi:hypothetical protein